MFQELRLLNQSIPSHVNPSHENIVILEDAFGNYLRLPRESILSWKVSTPLDTKSYISN